MPPRPRRARLRHSPAARQRVAAQRATRSRFARISRGHPGVDPYTTAVSDVYQDLFGEGTFTGKGIYDVDAFEPRRRALSPITRSSATT